MTQHPTTLTERPSTPTVADSFDLNTPNSRKRRDYKTLHNWGLQGKPNSPIQTQAQKLAPPFIQGRKKTKTQPLKGQSSSQSLSQFDSQVESQVESQVDSQLSQALTIDSGNDNLLKKDKSKKWSWFWLYFTTTVLDSIYKRDRKQAVYDKLYTCKVNKNCKFEQKALRTHSTTTAFTKHLKEKHQITESTKPLTHPTVLAKQAKPKPQEVQKSFEDALLDWIIYTCQPFTTTESDWYLRMMKAAGCTDKIPKADTISNKIYIRISIIKQELQDLLKNTCLTIAFSVNKQTSQNSLLMFAINRTRLGPDLY